MTCARHLIDYQVNQFLTDFLFSSAESLGKISTERISSYSHVTIGS